MDPVAPHLETIVSGTKKASVLTVDFRGGRRERGFLDLFASEARGFTVYGTIPIGLDRREAIPLNSKAYAEVYARELMDLSDGPFAVLGYCAGGAIAYSVASILSDSGADVRLLGLFDCASDFRAEIDTARADILEGLGVDSAMEWVERWRVSDGGDGSVDSSMPDLESLVEVSLRRNGIDEELLSEFADELVRRYRAWIAYLAAASAFIPARLSVPTVLFAAEGEPVRTDWPTAATPRLREFKVDHATLLADPVVVHEVGRLMNDFLVS